MAHWLLLSVLSATIMAGAAAGQVIDAAGMTAPESSSPGPRLSRWLAVSSPHATTGQRHQEPGDPAREQLLRAQLAARGIGSLRDWRREGTVFRATAEWYGEIVDLHVDAESGEVTQPERLKGTQIEHMLRQQGWGVVKDVKRSGDTFVVDAERDRIRYDLMIDAKTGHIRHTR